MVFEGDAWPESFYRKEIKNRASSYWVLEQALVTIRSDPPPSAIFLGYAGFWVINDEAHLMTFAIDPRWQGRGLGEGFSWNSSI